MQIQRVVVLAAIAVIARAQSPADGRRIPPSGTPLLEQYDFGAQVKELQNGSAASSGPAKPQAVGPPVVLAPRDFHPKDVHLSQTEEEAIKVSEHWRGSSATPTTGPDGRVLYVYGSGLASVVCAPLRVCIIELQAGEKIVGEPQIGDSVRWLISPAMFGTGDQATPMIVLKPQSPGLDTNLLITTDRRAYYLRLISKPEEYVARVAFAYPEDDSTAKWQRQEAAQKAQEKAERKVVEMPAAVIAAEKLDFDYRVSGGPEDIRPRRVFDDGSKTYIEMPPAIQNREAPVLLVIGTDGKSEMTNYRVKNQIYIVDRLFDRANLVLGAGKKARKVEIVREPKG